MSVPKEILQKVKLLEIQTRKKVDNLFLGEYKTAFKGQGMTFSDFREYVPGDDVRAISWPLTARTGKTYIKKFQEEREMTIWLAVDVSGSTEFGTGRYFKGEVMTHLAALLALSAIKNQDQVGLILFSDQIEHVVMPQKGRGHVHRILRDLYFVKPHRKGTNFSVLCDYLMGVLKKKCTLFLMSDFLNLQSSSSMKLLGKKHELIACVVDDRGEFSKWNLGLLDILDPETGEQLLIDTGHSFFSKELQINWKKMDQKRSLLLRGAQIDRIDFLDSSDLVGPLIKYFRQKHRRS